MSRGKIPHGRTPRRYQRSNRPTGYTYQLQKGRWYSQSRFVGGGEDKYIQPPESLRTLLRAGCNCDSVGGKLSPHPLPGLQHVHTMYSPPFPPPPSVQGGRSVNAIGWCRRRQESLMFSHSKHIARPCQWFPSSATRG